MSSLYVEASSVLEAFLDKKGGIKALAFHKDIQNKRAVYALVCETAKYHDVLLEVISKTPIESERKKKPGMVAILVYELLIGRGKIFGGGTMKKAILKHSHRLSSALVRLKISKGVRDNEELLPENLRLSTEQLAIPRYVRVNTLKTNLQAVVAELKETGIRVCPTPASNTFPVSESTSVLPGTWDGYADEHVPDLLVLAPGTELHAHRLVTEGHVLLQDKASCLPAYILASVLASTLSSACLPSAVWSCLDACAAPGNKTTHLAALLKQKWPEARLHACEKDPRRYQLLSRMLARAGAGDVVTHEGSFLDVREGQKDLRHVRGVLCDPTCSGSGYFLIELMNHYFLSIKL
jgi:putative methyltransferase